MFGSKRPIKIFQHALKIIGVLRSFSQNINAFFRFSEKLEKSGFYSRVFSRVPESRKNSALNTLLHMAEGSGDWAVANGDNVTFVLNPKSQITKL